MPAEEGGKRSRDREKDRKSQDNMAERDDRRRRSPLVEKKSKDSQRRREEERLDRRHIDRPKQRSRSPARNDSRERGKERSREGERRRDRSRERDHRRGGREEERGGREEGWGGRQQHRRRDEREREERKLVRVKEERDRNDERRREDKQRKLENPFEGGEGGAEGEGGEEEADKDQPNFELSGALTEETNKFRGVVIKYREPPEARKPRKRWRLYPFKGEEALKPLHIHRQSAYLLGRERLVADIPIDHPSCSKQHAALQYRLVDYEKPDGTTGRRVKPYIIDLESANGTYVNNQRIEASRYVELLEKDVVKFGYSSREYVLLHDTSDTSGVQAGEDDEGLDD